MASCKECLHYDVCEARIAADENYSERNYTENNNCSNFKDRTRFVELPCKVGDTVYCIKAMFSFLPVPKAEKIQKIELYDINIIFRTVNRAFNDKDIGKTVFLTREEAERVLNSSEKPNSRKEKTNG